jgi:hypothetical protein
MSRLTELVDAVVTAGGRMEYQAAKIALQAEVTRLEAELVGYKKLYDDWKGIAHDSDTVVKELRAKLAALEKQEPVAVMKQHHLEDFPTGTALWAYFPKGRPPAGSKLYRSAGAKE